MMTKIVAAADGEVQIALDHEARHRPCVRSRTAMRGGAAMHAQSSERHRRQTVKMASATMMKTMPVTTAEVAASPTAAALRPHCMPRRQPAMATSTPKTDALNRPTAKSPSVDGVRLRAGASTASGRSSSMRDADERAAEDAEQVRVDVKQRHHQDQRQHPRQDQELDGRDAQRLRSASISSFTCIVPSWAAKAAPVRPAMMMAAISAPISRAMRDADEVGHVDLRAELPQLDGADEGQDHPDQEADQRDDGERLRAGLLDRDQEVRAAETRSPADESPERQGGLAARKVIISRASRPARAAAAPRRARNSGGTGCRVSRSGTAAARSRSFRTPAGSPDRSASRCSPRPTSSAWRTNTTKAVSQSSTPRASNASARAVGQGAQLSLDRPRAAADDRPMQPAARKAQDEDTPGARVEAPCPAGGDTRAGPARGFTAMPYRRRNTNDERRRQHRSRRRAKSTTSERACTA